MSGSKPNPGRSPSRFVPIIKLLLNDYDLENDKQFDEPTRMWLWRIREEGRADEAIAAWKPNMRDTASTRIRDFLWAHRLVFTCAQVMRACGIKSHGTYKSAVVRLTKWKQCKRYGYSMITYCFDVVPRKLPNAVKTSMRMRKAA